MNTTKQFWTLFRFQAFGIHPAFWVMPLVCGFPFFIPLITESLSKDYHPSLYSFFANQNLFFVAMFGSMILAPEKFQFGSSNVTSSYYGTEFILTRAIDRPVLYRAKATVLYLMLLLVPCLGVAHSLSEPDLVFSEYSKSVQQECLSSVPGSVLLPPKEKRGSRSLVSIPRGNVLVVEWQLWTLLSVGILLQLSLLALYRLKYGKAIFWVLFSALILVPLFDLTSIAKDTPTLNEHLFFSFAADPMLFWMLTATVFILAQLWCERRFARLEP